MKSSSKSKQKRTAWKKGLWAEELAKWYLRLKGYWILHHRYKTPMGEIDLIIRRGNTMVFVEVKLRSTSYEALESISVFQQQRIRRAADFYLRNDRKIEHVRFDVFLVKPYSFPVHIENAFF